MFRPFQNKTSLVETLAINVKVCKALELKLILISLSLCFPPPDQSAYPPQLASSGDLMSVAPPVFTAETREAKRHLRKEVGQSFRVSQNIQIKLPECSKAARKYTLEV